jgi:hypothetical protein
MRDLPETKLESPSHSPSTSAPSENIAEPRVNFPDDELPSGASRLDPYGRYDLSWDGAGGGCGTDEGY